MNQLIDNLLQYSNMKEKYIELVKKKLDTEYDESFYKEIGKNAIKKSNCYKESILKNIDNLDEILKLLGQIEITLDKNTISGVGYVIVSKIICKITKNNTDKETEIYNDLVKNLHEKGVVVIPLLTSEELNYYHNSLITEIDNFPEYLDNLESISKGKRQLVMGGFGALGNPSSIHNLTSRKLRRRIMDVAKPFFKSFTTKYLSDGNIYLEQLFDRLSVRVEGTSTTKESWHRDIAPLKKEFPNDEVFGGWVNLDLKNDQYFSCVPKTHLEKTKKAGFVQEKSQSVLEKEFRPLAQKIRCPPGHWICFYQNIMHEVLAIKQKKGFSMKQYFGWRLSKDEEPLFSKNEKIIYEQGLPQIPSGQIPWMYTSSHMQFHQNKLIEWSLNNFNSECLEEKVNKNNEKYEVVKRYLPSLEKMGMKIYDDYDEIDINVMKPQLL